MMLLRRQRATEAELSINLCRELHSEPSAQYFIGDADFFSFAFSHFRIFALYSDDIIFDVMEGT